MQNKIKLIRNWFHEYFKRCKPQTEYLEKENIFYVCGHRGSPVHEIENTIPSFEQAIKEGANSLEVDLCITKDGEVIIWHDWDPNSAKAILRESGFEPWVKYKPHPPSIMDKYRKPIKELNLKEFLEHFDYKNRKGEAPPAKAEKPTLKEFLKWAKDEKKLLNVCFDIKAPEEDIDLALCIIKSLKKNIDELNSKFNCLLETTYPAVLNKMKENYPEFSYCLDIEPPAGFVLEPEEYSAVKAAIEYRNDYALAFRPRKITIANYTTFRRIVRNDVRLRSEYNRNNSGNNIVKLLAGTVNKRKELRCMVKLGVGGIQTDFPERLRKIAEKAGCRLE